MDLTLSSMTQTKAEDLARNLNYLLVGKDVLLVFSDPYRTDIIRSKPEEIGRFVALKVLENHEVFYTSSSYNILGTEGVWFISPKNLTVQLRRKNADGEFIISTWVWVAPTQALKEMFEHFVAILKD